MTLKPTTAYIPVPVEERLPQGMWHVPVFTSDGYIDKVHPVEIKSNPTDYRVWLDRRENVYVLTEKEYEAMWEDIEHRVKMRLADGSDMRHTFWKGLRYDVEKKLGK